MGSDNILTDLLKTDLNIIKKSLYILMLKKWIGQSNEWIIRKSPKKELDS